MSVYCITIAAISGVWFQEIFLYASDRDKPKSIIFHPFRPKYCSPLIVKYWSFVEKAVLLPLAYKDSMLADSSQYFQVCYCMAPQEPVKLC